MDTLIFLCTGNTCRSPMAAGFFKALDGEKRLGLSAESAGLFTVAGLKSSENAVVAAEELGADIRGHVSRQLTAELAAKAKYLVCMTGAHYDKLLAQYPKWQDKIFTLSAQDIADPFGGDLTVYRHAAQQIRDTVEQLIAHLEVRKA